MSDLTEQWKKGGLERGWYYVLLFSNEEYITFIAGKWVVDDRLVEADIKEVLSPVLSYEEYLESESHCAVYSEVNKSLKEENAKLKELLREWAQFETEENPNDFTVISERMSELANKTKHIGI